MYPADICLLCIFQNGQVVINRKRFGRRWRPRGEKNAFAMLTYLRKLHSQQCLFGGRSHHEQSAKSRAPSNGVHWPWAISRHFEDSSVTVAACAVRMLVSCCYRNDCYIKQL